MWEPFMVDAAIALPFKLESISQALDSPLFISSCTLAAGRAGAAYAEFDWTTENIVHNSRGGWFFYTFLKRAARRVVALGNFGDISQGDFEEICSIVLEEIANAVGKFRPASRKGAGGKSWGFEAYLQNYSIKRAVKPSLQILGSPLAPRKGSASFVSMDETDEEGARSTLSILESSSPDKFAHFDKSLASLDEKVCKKIVFNSVREALAGHPGAGAYYFHVVRGDTIRQTCHTLHLSKSKCHRLVQEASTLVWDRVRHKIEKCGGA